MGIRWRAIFRWTPLARRVAFGLALLAAGITLGLLNDLGKSDWASWVQAVGSIVAIVASVSVVWWQHRLDAERQREEERDRRTNTLRTTAEALEWLGKMLATLESRRPTGRSYPETVQAHYPSARVRKVVLFLQEVSLADVGGFEVWLAIMDCASTMQEMSTSVAHALQLGQVELSVPEWERLFDSMAVWRTSADEAARQVRAVLR